MISLFKRKAIVVEEVTREKLRAHRPTASLTTPYLDEYAKVAAEVGVDVPEVNPGIKAFAEYLRSKDWGVFSLPQVVSYMDRAAGMVADRGGWSWRPLRKKDAMASDMRFGFPIWNADHGRRSSDWYDGNYPPRVYGKTVPLHALRKVAQVEKEFKGPKVHFFVADYDDALSDPFLLAVIANRGLHDGFGRFVIDFWDEPGFGIEQMMKGEE